MAGSAVFSDGPAPPPPPAPQTVGDEALRKCIEKGLLFLGHAQNKTSGALEGDNSNFSGLATAGLAGMAFLSGGNLPGRGLYGKNVELCIRWILDNASAASGYLQFTGSNMYSHGFAALFLAEAYGTIPPYMKLQPRVFKVLKKAVDLLEKSQGPEGGWWYNPTRQNAGNGADISVTVCETNALRAARNCGIAVDKRVVENALKCVKAAQNDDGGFCYRVQPNGKDGGGSLPPRSSGAVCILQALGAYDDVATKKGLEYLRKNAVDNFQSIEALGHGYYAIYYLSQSMFMAGDETWKVWWEKIRKTLITTQQPDGSWSGGYGKCFGTAIALIILQMPYRYLPIYQEGIESANKPKE
jgi:hypothetical protein